VTHYAHRFSLALLTALLCQGQVACATPVVTGCGQGQVLLPSKEIDQLSGMTYLGGDDYLMVSDKGGRIAKASIQIDPETGQITQATINDVYTLPDGRDLEDIAYDPSNQTMLVCDESSSRITRHRLDDGRRTHLLKLPRVFLQPRDNLGLESLSLSPDAKHLWAANEEALPSDGPRATSEQGTLVRLLRMDASDSGNPTQFAYRTDPHDGDNNLFNIKAQCGVVGLIALPEGRVIVMERELGGVALPGFRIRLYLVEPEDSQALDPAASALSQDLVPIQKTLLHEVNAGLANFEGIALGPQLSNGDYTLILISDDGGGTRNPQSLLTLRLSGSAAQGRRW